MRLFREVTGVEQALVQQIVDTDEEAYLADICDHTKNAINNTVANMLTHLQENYEQLMPPELCERNDIFKKMIYHPRDLIATVLSSVKEILEFSDITGTSYTHLQAVNTAYAIIHRTGKFRLEIHEWNCTKTVQNTWVGFKQYFWTAHRELRKTSDLTVEDAGMHHSKMVRNVIAGLQEVLQQEQAPTENPTITP